MRKTECRNFHHPEDEKTRSRGILRKQQDRWEDEELGLLRGLFNLVQSMELRISRQHIYTCWLSSVNGGRVFHYHTENNVTICAKN